MGIDKNRLYRAKVMNRVLGAVVGGALALTAAAGYTKYASTQKGDMALDELTTNPTDFTVSTYALPDHDNDKLILHLKDGKTLADVDAFSRPGLEYLAQRTTPLFDLTSQEGTEVDDTYVVDPDAFDDQFLNTIKSALSEDAQGDVVAVEYNITFTLDDQVSQAAPQGKECYSKDPLCDRMYGMDMLNAKDVHVLLSSTEPKQRSVVYVLDTGVAQHKDLQGVLTKSTPDGHGHGTHCAGSVGAVSNNKEGVFSLDPNGKFLEIRSIKVLSDSGSGSLDGIAKGIVDAAKDGADVISMSLGGYSPRAPASMTKAVQYAQEQGAIVVVAAGNSNADADRYTPANVKGVIRVSANDADMKRASFSNYNTDITAPGVDIFSTVPEKNGMKPGSPYIAISGTSMATPHVAGIVGIMRAVDPDLTRDEVLEALKVDARPAKSEKNKPIGPIPDVYKGLQSLLE